ncbi:glycosyltransferase [Winogradskyella echinorum]|uniref:Glycosyltransferase n=1 Tax=Winogradskyella echinorum TaxID=538189 RepID=A0ABR6XXY1_9FLAO|nr:glycosyltransferase [Winogradskyella echinorum]MBC3845363.1 glycosyltransferase [Winogradskyella echinorum]MBC5749711.1 glycosyltransferase [Winogradskyella echinorum]
MKTGIIIVFHNNEKEMDTTYFIEQIKQISNIEFCLVNNDSRDNTYDLLRDVRDECNNVSVVNVRKFKSDMAAVKAGARFMFNEFNLKYLGYVSVNNLNIKEHGLNGLIELITENQNAILNFKISSLKKKQTLFQSIYSLLDYLKKIIEDNHFINLQFQRNI